MNKQELRIEEGNRLIGKFMGATVFKDKLWFITVESGKFHDGTNAATFDRVAYHSSWDWLMPVVEKISNIHYGWEIREDESEYSDCAYPRTFGMKDADGSPMVRLNGGQVYVEDTLIEATWKAVIDFIQWYISKQKGGQ